MARRKKTTDEQAAEVPASSSDDNFGLPDIEYKPLDRTSDPDPEPVVEPEHTHVQESIPAQDDTRHSVSSSSYQSTYSYTEPSSGSSIFPKVAGIILVILLALAGTWYFAMYKPQKEAEAKVLAEKKRKDAEAKEEQARLAEQQRLEDERRRAEEEANAKPKEGSIETLSERTKRYYVVIASSIDADLVMDYAKKLSAKGVSCKIIPPYGKVKFSRLTIAEGDTYTDTQQIADGMKGEYGDALWVIKY